MKVIVGLGNYEPKYDGTRHNVGFDVLDRLARRYAPGEVARSRFHAATLDGRIGGENVLLVRPMKYMNRSGLSVNEVVRFFKVDPAEDLLILVDEVALPCGAIRLRGSGSAGGHNGLADIEKMLGRNDYPRLRIGVDDPGRIPRKDYVLGKFTDEQKAAIEPALEDAVNATVCWATRGLTEAMNTYNRKQNETKDEIKQ